MYFKNATIYRLTAPWPYSPEHLSEQLELSPARPPSPLSISSRGWVPPLGRNSQMYAHTANGCHMICAKVYKKTVPAAAVNEEVQQRADEIRRETGRTPHRREQADIKEAVAMKMLPGIPATPTVIYAYIDAVNGLLIVNGNAKQSLDLIDMLDATLGRMPAMSAYTNVAPSDRMTQWAGLDDQDDRFLVGTEFRLGDISGADVACKHVNTASRTIAGSIESGLQVTRLALTWNDRISFALDDVLTLSKIKFGTDIQQAAADIEAEDEASRFDADFAIMTGELRDLIGDIFDAFGGLVPLDAAA